MSPLISIHSRRITNGVWSRLIRDLTSFKNLDNSYALTNPIISLVFHRSDRRQQMGVLWPEFVAVRGLFDVSGHPSRVIRLPCSDMDTAMG